MTLLQLFRQSDRTARRITARRPSVEGLEGRRLLSGVVGNHVVGNVAQDIKSWPPVADIQGAHIGSPMIVGRHIGSPDIIAII